MSLSQPHNNASPKYVCQLLGLPSPQTANLTIEDCLLPCTQGQVQVELCSEANDQPDEEVMELLRRSENVVAVESPAYFRAYQPVLEALKTIDVSKIHFM